MSQITWIDLFNSIIALGALAFSIYNFWYTKFRRTRLTYICNGWTILVSSKRDKSGNHSEKSAFFLLDISIRNEGAKSVSIKDFILRATDTHENIFYFNPVSLFDFDYFSSNMGNANPLKAQKGLVPLPLEIPSNTNHKFDYPILFMPWSKANKDILNLDDYPIKVEVLVNDEFKDYEPVATQLVKEDSVKDIKQGSFSAIESTATVKKRIEFIQNES